MKKVRQLGAVAFIAAVSGWISLAAGPANATTIQVNDTFPGSDCSGLFGQGFDNCKIPITFDPNQSPVIIKFGFGDEAGLVQISSAFPTITGSEFAFTISGNGSSGSWTYTPGDGDPGITFWVAKGGNFFNLFTDSSGNPVTSGTWLTPLNPANEQRFGLSHLTFYDTGGRPPTEIPEPGTLLLAGAALAALGMMRRRRT